MYEMGPEEECVIQFHAILHQTLQRSSKRRLQEPIRQFLGCKFKYNNIKLIKNWDDLDLNVTIEGWMCKKKNPYEN